MIHFRHILFPVDFSEPCANMVPFVQAYAAHFGARATLLNVLETPPAYFVDSTAFMAAIDMDNLLKSRTQRLESFAPEAFRNPQDQRVVKEGIPALTILDFVEREGVDLIMIPSRGFGPFRSLLLGSTTAKVLHDVQCPVWTTVHAEYPTEARIAKECRRILGAVDLTAKSVGVIRCAKEMAHSYGASVRLIHAAVGLGAIENIASADKFRSFILNFAREEIEKLQRQAGTSDEVEICGGEVAPVVNRAAIDFNADLVVIGRGTLQKPLGRLRTSAYAIIRECPCPVLSV